MGASAHSPVPPWASVSRKPVLKLGPALNTRPSGAWYIHGYRGSSLGAVVSERQVPAADCHTSGMLACALAHFCPATTSTLPLRWVVAVGYHRRWVMSGILSQPAGWAVLTLPV